MSHDKLEHEKPEKIGLDKKALKRLSAALEREIDAGRLPGAVAMIARGGRIGYFESFGKRSPAASDAMEKDAIFRIFSMTKPIVSTVVMQLAEEGRLQLADPLSKYIPAFADTKVGVVRDGELALEPPRRAILLHDLLRHTSGITYDFLGDHPVQRLYAQAKLARPDQTNADQAEAIAKLPLLNHPGVQWDYGRSTDVLGAVVEIVTGQTLGEALRARVFDPLDMKDTGFHAAGARESRIAEPFPTDPETGAPVKLFNAAKIAPFESGGGGLVSTAQDYARFCMALVNGGSLGKTRLLGRKTLEFMASDHLGPHVSIGANDLLPPGHGFGLGYAVRLEPGIAATPGSPGLFFWGGIAGTTFWIDPEEDLFGLLLIQAPGQRDYYRMLFRSLVYAAVD
ncbi:MAG: serine hydrolase [Hyphomicrobiales bacterium]|nr:serine hydrolase [Hyphomicrobiales bacterium]